MLKGHAVIELTNVKTGKKQVIEEDNLFTNIFSELLNDNNFGIIKEPDFLPIASALQGVIIFSEAQTESADHMFPDLVPIAYAGSSTDAGTDIKKGTYNPTESGEVTNGYKHVWDFTTSQGNGTVASISLVSPNNGNAWMTEAYTTVKVLGSGMAAHITEGAMLDADKQLFLWYDSTAQSFKILNIKTVLNSLTSVNARFFTDACPYTVEEEISISEENAAIASSGVVYRLNGNTLEGYAHARNTSGDATIYKIAVNAETFSYTETTLTVPNVPIEGFGIGWRTAGVLGNFLYCRNYSNNKLVKVNLTNPSDVTQYDYTQENNFTTCDELLNVVVIDKNRYMLPDGTIGTGGNWYDTYPKRLIGKLGIKELVSEHPYVKIVTPKCYLGTINNLSEPVIKTSAQTMKISYTIYDYDEEQSSTSNASAGGTNAVSTEVSVGSD